MVKEITNITKTTGTMWTTPSYDALGSFISTPQPQAPATSFGLKWDAWNRMVEVSTGGNFVARWAYDGAQRRISQLNGDEFRHYYYSDQWQVLEERTGDNAFAERRFIWGMRGVDDLVCRDRGSERLYALNDPANVTAIVDVIGVVQERYGYSGFGVPRYMDANFDSRSSSDYDWETLFCGYRYDAKTGLYLPRERILHARLGRWLSRDPIGYQAGNNLYGGMSNGPMNRLDPFGLADAPADVAAFMEKYAQEHEGAQPWVGWWDTHQNRAFYGWYRGDDAERYGLVFNPNWANLNAPAPPEGTKPWVEPSSEPSVGFWEGLIPVWGSGKQAYLDFDSGRWGWGIFNTALAASDVIPVRALIGGAGKGLWKFGSHTWSATSKWLTKRGWREVKGQEMHHWLIPQRGWGAHVPSWLKNQPWNLMPMPDLVFHDAIHGTGKGAYNMAGRLFYGSPQWFRAGIFSVGGREANWMFNEGSYILPDVPGSRSGSGKSLSPAVPSPFFY